MAIRHAILYDKIQQLIVYGTVQNLGLCQFIVGGVCEKIGFSEGGHHALKNGLEKRGIPDIEFRKNTHIRQPCHFNNFQIMG